MAALAVGLLVISGCNSAAIKATASDSPANNAAQLIAQFQRNTQFLHNPPLGGVSVAQARDAGSNSTVAGRDPGVITIFATTASVKNLVHYYEATYPQLHFHVDCCMTTARASMLGNSGFINFAVEVAAGHPYIPAHYPTVIKGQQPTNPIYVTVAISGQPRGS